MRNSHAVGDGALDVPKVESRKPDEKIYIFSTVRAGFVL